MPANKRYIISSLDKIDSDREYDTVVSVRIPKEILETIDTWVTDAKRQSKKANRSTLIVKLLRDALRLEDQKN